ncbi:hypothetical protein PHJA_000673700 [Phtheirospermum japonicum]|uniref:Uncharacterized protein n=1 Tax=Phtheirospermum japonicum TaxID=374723 RepID=A0A830BCE8_9LAMI|nr:hypothetical protein PHJA_000673700 [Phtheirospermum japonicum]
MEQSSLGTRHQDETDFSLKEWALKAKISRTNTSSRRFSESNLRSFRENALSFRSNITISSTASSPGYTLKGEIDPSTYSFTTAPESITGKNSGIHGNMCHQMDTLSTPNGMMQKNTYAILYQDKVPMECLSAKDAKRKIVSQRNKPNHNVCPSHLP